MAVTSFGKAKVIDVGHSTVTVQWENGATESYYLDEIKKFE